VAAQLEAAHVRIHEGLAALQANAATGSTESLHQQLAAFTGEYLAHMHLEETVLEPRIRQGVPMEDLAASGRRAVETTPPQDQRMMLGWMLPALPTEVAQQFLARLPPALAGELRANLS
jgi:hypothetical protein